MKKIFEYIEDDDFVTLLEVPVIITFLVAGCDNNIDSQERDWAERLIEFRSQRNHPALVEYYMEVERNWEDNFQKYAARFIDYEDVGLRTDYLNEQLAKSNSIIDKIDPVSASLLYESFKTFAKQVAKASGGLFGFGAISPEEHQHIGLNSLKTPALN